MSWFRRKPKYEPVSELQALDNLAINVAKMYWECGYPAVIVRGEGTELSILGPHMPAETGHAMLTAAATAYRTTEGLPTQQ